jgi:ubiquinone biosynthesis protein
MNRHSLAASLVGGPEGFRALLEKRGPAFIMLGRFLALRPDILPHEYHRELMELSDEVPPFPWDEAAAILTHELGDLPAVFESIAPRPVAIRPLAQVHQAVTREGHTVAVKILRPQIHERVEKDLRRTRLFARLIPWRDSGLMISPGELAEELRAWLMRELDLTRELANIQRLTEVARGNPKIRVPRVYPELSTTRVLTTESLSGIPLTDILSPTRRSDLPLEDSGFSADELARNLMGSMLQQMFEHSFYNADVHPRNLLFFAGNTIGFADFGHFEKLDQVVSREQARFIGGIYRTGVAQMFRTFLEQLVPTVDSDVEGLRDAFMTASHEWLRSPAPVKLAHRSHNGHSPTADWMIAVVRAAQQNKFRIPAGMLGVCRTLVTVEGIAYGLEPSVHLQSVGREFFLELQLQEAFRFLKPEVQHHVTLNLLTTFRDAPEYLNQILAELAGGRFTLNLSATQHPRSANTRDRRSRLLVAALACVGVAGVLGERGLPVIASIPASVLLGATLGLLYLYIAIQWRRLR